MGDGTLIEFGSVVDAVSFAVDVQRAMALRNTNVPKDQHIAYRIGINIGDIIVEGEDIYGDGVNVAARLEALAEPGGICTSSTVVNHVEGKVELDFTDLGTARPRAPQRKPLVAEVSSLIYPGVANCHEGQAGMANYIIRSGM